MPTKTSVKDIPTDVIQSAQQIWHAGLGILTLAQEEGGKLFETLVDAGKHVERAIPSPSEALHDATVNAETYWKQFQKMLDVQIAGALHRLGVPTKDEIDRLTKRIEQLTAAIEALRARS